MRLLITPLIFLSFIIVASVEAAVIETVRIDDLKPSWVVCDISCCKARFRLQNFRKL